MLLAWVDITCLKCITIRVRHPETTSYHERGILRMRIILTSRHDLKMLEEEDISIIDKNR
jgi:hypothetical protein